MPLRRGAQTPEHKENEPREAPTSQHGLGSAGASAARRLPVTPLSPPCRPRPRISVAPSLGWAGCLRGPALSFCHDETEATRGRLSGEPSHQHVTGTEGSAASGHLTGHVSAGRGGRTDAPTLENHDAHGAPASRKQSRLGGSAEPRGLQALGKGTGPVVSPPPSRPRACLFLPFCRTPRGRLRKQERGERLGQPSGAQRKGHNGWGAPLSPGSPALGPPDHCRVQGRECSQVPTAPGGSAGPALGAPRQPSAFPEAPSHHSRSRGTLVFGLLFTLL